VEGLGVLIVSLHKGLNALPQFVFALETGPTQGLARQQGKPDFDLI